MPNLYTLTARKQFQEESLTRGEITSIIYHNIFDYPLSFPDLIKWQAGESVTIDTGSSVVVNKSNFYFLEGKEGHIYKRILGKRISDKKLEIAKKASRILSFIPSIKMIAITGSLAMQNSTEEGDIDLMVVTKSGMLWATRLMSYLTAWLFGIKLRSPGDKNQKDKLCLNMWFDENDLIWRSRNIYTAHEIAQVIPLVNRDETYEKFIWKNRWIKKYWPNAVRIKKVKEYSFRDRSSFLNIFESIAFKLQYLYMRRKITREVVAPTRALFHPVDWSGVILHRLEA